MTSGAAGHGNAAVHNSYVSLLGGTFRTRQINPPTPMLCYCDFMLARRLLLLLCLLAPLLLAQQPKSGIPEPSLPVIDDNACPFEGCSFGKWIVTRDFKLFSSWKEDRKPLTAVRKGQVVDALTGVHITYEPDRIQVFRPIADLHLNPGDVILRYMYRGEGFADI